MCRVGSGGGMMIMMKLETTFTFQVTVMFGLRFLTFCAFFDFFDFFKIFDFS